MVNENEIRKFVRLQIYKGRNLSAIFDDLCLKFCGKSPGIVKLGQWFRNLQFDVDKFLPPSIRYNRSLEESGLFRDLPTLDFNPREGNDPIPPYEFHQIIKVIATEFEKVHRAYESRKCAGKDTVVGCHVILLSERYAIDIGVVPDKCQNANNYQLTSRMWNPSFPQNGQIPRDNLELYLIDTLHNVKQKLKLNGAEIPVYEAIGVMTKSGFQPTAYKFDLVALDSEYFLHVGDHNYATFNQRGIGIRLFKLDVAGMQCTAMDSHTFGGFNAQTVVDSNDPRKFLICYFDPHHSKRSARKYRLTDDGKLEVDDEKLDIEFQIAGKNVFPYNESYKYEGDKLYGIGRNRDKREFVAFEATFEKGKSHALQLAYFEIDEEITEIDFQGKKFVWSTNTCWMLRRNRKQEHFLYKFDLNSQQVTETKICVYDRICCASLKNGRLNICTNNERGQHTWHRISLSSPDSLLNLSMDRLQRDVIFMEDVKYIEFIQSLPPNLRPFGQTLTLDQQKPECSTNNSLPGPSTKKRRFERTQN